MRECWAAVARQLNASTAALCKKLKRAKAIPEAQERRWLTSYVHLAFACPSASASSLDASTEAFQVH